MAATNDIDDTLTLDPDAVRSAITERTKAVMPVHMCGSMADLGELKKLCDEHNLILLEDACQAIGGSYEGKPLGSYGDLGCFSFDYVKTVTCGEGGAIITNNATYYQRADHFSDHGHDHHGSDRGAEEHPFLGYNFRISEINAAIGLAQLRRLEDFIAIQKRNYSILKEAIKDIEGLTFRRIPENGVENYSFLNFFMPDENLARKAVKMLGESGVDGCFYWYDNNWHYHRKWDHLKEKISLSPLSQTIGKGIDDWKNRDFGKSDGWMSRTISCLVKLSWTEEETRQRAASMNKAIRAIL